MYYTHVNFVIGRFKYLRVHEILLGYLDRYLFIIKLYLYMYLLYSPSSYNMSQLPRLFFYLMFLLH